MAPKLELESTSLAPGLVIQLRQACYHHKHHPIDYPFTMSEKDSFSLS